MTYKQLPLVPKKRGYNWTFHPSTFFISLLFEMVKLWISCFEFDYEKSLMLGQAFDLRLRIELSYENGWEMVWSR